MQTRRAGRSLRPRIESLEARALLSAAPMSAEVAAANRRYIDAIAGEPAPGDPDTTALRERMARRLDRGAGRAHVVFDLLRSRPAGEAMVRLMYRALLDRDPTAREVRAGRALLDRGGDLHDLLKVVASSGEFYRRAGGTGAGFADAVARHVLGRAATADERAMWGRFAARHGWRRHVLGAVVEGREFRRGAATEVLADLGRAPTTDELLRATRLLAAPGGLPRLRARVLGSDTAYARLSREPVTPPTPGPLPGDVNDNPPGLPLAFGPAFTSGNQPIPAPPGSGGEAFSSQVLTAAYDGTLYAGGPSGLLVFDAASQAWSAIAGASVSSASAVSATEVWAVEQQQPGAWSLAHYINGEAVAVPALPAGAIPDQVAAGADGTVWVLTDGDAVLALNVGGTGWDPVVAGTGPALAAITVGSRDNIWAIGYDQEDNPVPYRWTADGGWARDTSFPAASVDDLFATSDGAVWAVTTANGQPATYVLPVGGTWYQVDATSLPGSPGTPQLAPVSQLQAYSLAGGATYSLATIGLVDQQPAIPFPAFAGPQLAAYDAISDYLGATGPGGVRGQYGNDLISPSSWEALLEDMPVPSGITQPDFDAVKAQLLVEFAAVGNVQSVFGVLEGVNSGIQTQVNTLVPAIVEDIASSNNGSNEVALIVDGVIEAIAWGIAAAVPGVGPIIGSIVASAMGTAATILQEEYPGSNGGVQTAYIDYATMLSSYFTTINTTNAGYETAIYGDYGKLLAVSAQVGSGVWSVTPTQQADAIAAAVPVYEVYSYQALTPSQWQFVQFSYKETWGDLSPHDFMSYIGVPSYAYIYTKTGSYWDGSSYQITFNNAVGANTDVNWGIAKSYGPYPTQSFLSTIYDLPGQSWSTYWNRTSGWGPTNGVGGMKVVWVDYHPQG